MDDVPCNRGDFRHTYRLFLADETATNHGESTRFYATDTDEASDVYGRRNAT